MHKPGNSYSIERETPPSNIDSDFTCMAYIYMLISDKTMTDMMT